MTCTISIFGRIANVEVHDQEHHAALTLTFVNKVYGEGLTSDDRVTLFFEDKVLAHRIGHVVTEEIAARKYELAHPVDLDAIAAE